MNECAWHENWRATNVARYGNQYRPKSELYLHVEQLQIVTI